MKILSITVPIYNTENYIERCLDSILIDEIIDDIEVILVNDGSKDKSIDIMRQYEKKYPNTIVVIDKENGGHGSTINAALKVAKGKYFRVLDSDDWFDSNNFVTFIKKIKSEEVDLIVTNYRKEFVYNGISEEIKWNDLKENITYYFDKFNLKILNKEYFVMANSTYKTEILRKANLNLIERVFYVDMQYNIVPILYVNTFKFIRLDIYRYFIGRPDQSMNLDNFVRNRAHHDKVMRFLIEYYNKNLKRFSKNKEAYIKQILFYMLTTHYYIHCVYPKKDYKIIYKEIKEFDKYLKNINKDLYDMMYEIGQIKYNRKTKFIFVRISPQFFSRFLSFCRRINSKRNDNFEK